MLEKIKLFVRKYCLVFAAIAFVSCLCYAYSDFSNKLEEITLKINKNNELEIKTIDAILSIVQSNSETINNIVETTKSIEGIKGTIECKIDEINSSLISIISKIEDMRKPVTIIESPPAKPRRIKTGK